LVWGRERKKKKWWVPRLEGAMEGLQEWRVGGGFEGVCKMEVCLEVLLEMIFFTKPSNFGVEGHMEASTGVALKRAA
jgi:hypothetical protein